MRELWSAFGEVFTRHGGNAQDQRHVDDSIVLGLEGVTQGPDSERVEKE